MGKSKKGLSDEGQGDFILNESGTSVNVDHANDTAKKATEEPEKKRDDDDEPYMPPVADPQKDITD
jgi:hypothetical protein